MSNNRSNDELLAEFEKMLNEIGEKDNDEKDISSTIPDSSWWYSDDDDFDLGEKTTPPPIPKKKECEHRKVNRKQLLISYYFECADCGKEVNEKA